MQAFIVRLLVCVFVSSLCLTSGLAADSSQKPEISGKILKGQRHIEIDLAAEQLELHVYRGDYVQMSIKGGGKGTLVIAALSIEQMLPLTGEKPYIKFKKIGTYDFTIGSTPGTITVHTLARHNYSEVSSKEAADLIASIHPFILDVRTKREYAQGHLKDAYLLPVGELQRKVHELEQYKEQPVFIYCRSGNRSTVAAKILLDKGFKRVYNLRRGIKEWVSEKRPVVK